MAEKKADKKIERTYIIPLRKLTVKAPKWRRAHKAMLNIRRFLKRHMKSDDIKIGQDLNHLIWERGGKTIPPKVELTVLKEEGKIYTNLVGLPLPKKKEEKKVEKKTGEKKPEKKVEEKKTEKKEVKKEVKTEEKKEESKKEAKAEEKKEEEKKTEKKEEKNVEEKK